MQEEWRDVVGYEGFYQVSNLGRIKSLQRTRKGRHGVCNKSERILALAAGNRKGSYLMFSAIGSNGNKKTVAAHRLVAKAFIANPDNKPCVNHIDHNRLNNCVENLEWVTAKENAQHALLNGRLEMSMHRGEDNNQSKLTTAQVKEIRKRYVRYSKENNCTSLAKEFGVSHVTIHNIIKLNAWVPVEQANNGQ